MRTQYQSKDFERVARAIAFLADRAAEQPELADVAAAVGLSAGRTQRLFKRWAGVSPKRFLACLTVEHAKELLDRSASVLDTSYEVGLSGPGRLHDHFVKLEAMSPGEYKGAGDGLELTWGLHRTPFGRAFVAASGRGIVRLAFTDGADGAGAASAADGRSDGSESADRILAEVERMKRAWPGADVVRNQRATRELVERMFEPNADAGEVLVRVSGTNFQVAVWKALLAIPRGSLSTYQAIAEAAGRPGAFRAVGSAVGANPVAYLIPCHRVIRKSGAIGDYRWGATRKRALIAWETAGVVDGPEPS